jgi:hypothetical protein
VKPGARRAETEWDDDEVQSPAIGSASSTITGQSARFVGRLFIPDPEQRHGLREWYVYPDEPTPVRRTGFRKP